MATKFIPIQRETPMLLPPDLRDWVPQDHIVHFILEAVNAMRLPSLKVNVRGSGSPQYPPRMMLALLIYCYTSGIFSSRRMERATYDLVSVRYLTGDTHPDHDTIAKFRRENFAAVHEAFLEVLLLARGVGLLRVGTVSVDGTTIQANASKDRNVRYDRALELEKQLQHDIEELLQRAEQADTEDGDDGQSVPEKLARREKLLAKIKQAREELEASARQRAERERAGYEAKVKAREAQEKPRGRPPKPPSETPEAKAQANLTDGDSRLMKNKSKGFAQCYNAQAAVDADGTQLIVSQHVTNCASDANELLSAVENVRAEVGTPEKVVADAGYVNTRQWSEIEAAGTEVYVACTRTESHTRRRYDFRPREEQTKEPRKTTNAQILAMRAKMACPEAREIYQKRNQSAEPVFGIIKSAMGFRQFFLRGLEKVSGEWSLVTLAYNFKRLYVLMAT